MAKEKLDRTLPFLVFPLTREEKLLQADREYFFGNGKTEAQLDFMLESETPSATLASPSAEAPIQKTSPDIKK